MGCDAFESKGKIGMVNLGFYIQHEIDTLKHFRLFVRECTEPDDRSTGRAIIAELAVAIDTIEEIGGMVRQSIQRFNEAKSNTQREIELNQLERLREALVAINAELDRALRSVQDFIIGVYRR